MTLLERLRSYLGGGTDDTETYQCIRCGGTFDRKHYECPDCGVPHVVTHTGDSDERDETLNP
ncbi:hypothetical protein [Haladaptatus caseinilyticus]|uniref:hypothetical protein n=1 Tax=Haladaptatus caseinilyticus TaxID=2993314 RepID=UPI00224B8338|nr:hypothetical protein [Haladaptatus caseinilyticus]